MRQHVQLLVAAGKVLMLPDQVRARVVESGLLADKVRIEEGAFADREVWVAAEFVHAR
jgi:hypothetical protein